MNRRWVRIVVGVVLVGMMVFLGRQYFGEIRRLLEVHWAWIVAILAVYLVTRLLNAEVLRACLCRLGCAVGLYESFMLRFVMSYTNLIVPHAGLSAPAMYLKNKHALRYSDFGAVLMPMMVLQLICAGFMGLAGTVSMGLLHGFAQYTGLLLLFGAVAAGGLVVIFLPMPVPDRWQGRIARFFRRFGQSWRQLRSQRRLVAHVVVVHLVVILLRAVRLEFAFSAVGHGEAFLEIFVASICAQFMLLISLTPGAMGFREAAIGIVYARFAGSPEVAVAAALLDRIIMTLAIIGVSQIGMWQYIRPAIAQAASPGEEGDKDEPSSQ